MLNNKSVLPFAAWNQKLSELELEYAQEFGVLTYNMQPSGVPCFTPDLLGNIQQLQTDLQRLLGANERTDIAPPVRYLVHASHVPGIFNLGGNLERFAAYIRAQDRESLMAYATACIDVLYRNQQNLDCELTTIALVEGTAAGGGFEAALSSDVIIAEKGSEMGFPEAIFNLFPGMGAYSFLARRVAPSVAERIIKSGRMYKAEQLHDMGLVDELAEPGQGRKALYEFIRRHSKYANMHLAMKKVKDRVHKASFEELMDITTIWVDAAMQLPERNIRTMERLVNAQKHRTQPQHHALEAAKD